MKQIVLAVGHVSDASACHLLVRRNEPAVPEIHGRWEFPGGKVEFGEDPRATVKREIAEETGVSVAVGDMFSVPFTTTRRVEGIDVQPIILCFACELLGLPPRSHSLPAKVSEIRWIPAAELLSLPLQAGTRLFLESARLMTSRN